MGSTGQGTEQPSWDRGLPHSLVAFNSKARLEQPGVVEGIPAMTQGWTRWSLKSLPTQLILGFYESMNLSHLGPFTAGF